MPPAEAKRELNEPEAAYLAKLLEGFEPLLSPSKLVEGGDFQLDYNGQTMSSSSQDDEAWFDVGDRRVLIERRFMAIDLPGEGTTESVTWQVSVFDDGESEAAAGPSVEVFSVVKEGEIAGYAHYQRHYLIEDPETKLLHRLPPAEPNDEALAALEALPEADNFVARQRILSAALDAQEACRRELETLTGIDDSPVFTPERLRRLVALLDAIPR